MTSDDVRFWHKADLLNALTNVRFWGQSGHDLNGPLYRLMTQSGRSNLARLKSGAASSARLLATAEDTLSKGDGAPTKKSPGREKRKVVPGLKCYDWNSQFPAPYFAPEPCVNILPLAAGNTPTVSRRLSSRDRHRF